MIQLGLVGQKGRMGEEIQKALLNHTSLKISAAPNRGESFDSLYSTDVILDFASPAAVLELIQSPVQKTKKLPPLVVGSTGWSEEQLEVLNQQAQLSTVLMASNFSIGIAILNQILQQYSKALEAHQYTPRLTETHHVHKKDRPSGTALSWMSSIHPENPHSVKCESIRTGEVIGEHSVTFYGKKDQITFAHSVQNRSIFAEGALDVCIWLTQIHKKNPTPTHLLSMQDYLQTLIQI